jgi:hypothetical protein
MYSLLCDQNLFIFHSHITPPPILFAYKIKLFIILIPFGMLKGKEFNQIK